MTVVALEDRIPTAGWWLMREKNLRFEGVLDAVKEALEGAGHQFKYKRKGCVFVLNVDCGRHAIFMIARFNKGNFSVGVRSGASIDAVEDIKAKLGELYSSPARWTFGIDVWEIESDIKKIPPVRSFFTTKVSSAFDRRISMRMKRNMVGENSISWGWTKSSFRKIARV